jgi:hypothetical protein
MLTVTDIPDVYRMSQSDGENIARLASGVQTAIANAIGESGHQALLRFVQAGFLFRSGEIGRVMMRSSSVLSSELQDTIQLVNFAGGALTAAALVGAVDLTAAAFYRLHFGPMDSRDEGREADVHHFPRQNELPDDARRWLRETRDSESWEVLQGVRDQFVHRWFPLHITIGAGFGHHLEIAGERRSLDEFLDESRQFVVDRLVSAGLVMDSYARRHSA